MTAQLLSIASLLLLWLSQTAENKLADFIPPAKWETTGISKLTDSERAALGNEIRSLLLQYRSSLTDGVAVIAPSVSTSMKAREIRAAVLKKREVSLRYAEAILVVVRSSLFNPLRSSYDSVGELKRDADNQLNIAGPKFHVYTYSIDDDLAVSQL